MKLSVKIYRLAERHLKVDTLSAERQKIFSDDHSAASLIFIEKVLGIIMATFLY